MESNQITDVNMTSYTNYINNEKGKNAIHDVIIIMGSLSFREFFCNIFLLSGHTYEKSPN